MTKILSIINLNFIYTLQECYEEFIATSKIELLQNRDILSNAFEGIYKNLDVLYEQDEHFMEFFARIFYEVNCEFEFNCIYDFLKKYNHTSKWLEFAKNVFDEPKSFKAHFCNLARLYNEQEVGNINEEFIYLYLKYLAKLPSKKLQNEWQNCSEKSYLTDCLTQTLQNLSSDYIISRDMLLCEFDKYNKLDFRQIAQVPVEQNGKYERGLRQIYDINFYKILNYCRQYKTPYCDLERGKKILQTQDELVCYLSSYGTMHQVKLNDSFDVLCKAILINNLTINIIDYGCGQALASCVFLDFIKKRNVKISQIILIEPSNVALSRGILHLNLLGIDKSKIKAINYGLDDLKMSDLALPKQDINLHIFSNVLDLMSFRLDREFYGKISDSNKGTNIFVCVSPPYNNTQIRLDLFCRYFTDNHNASLISHRRNDIIYDNRPIKRYEYVFECKL